MMSLTTHEAISARIDGVLANFYMSPSAMKKLDSCQAYYLLERIIFPKIEPEEKKYLSAVGRTIHTIAENQFDKSTIAEELSDDTVTVKNKVEGMLENMKARRYADLPSENEKEIRCKLRDLGDVFGIMDKFIDVSDGDVKKCMIVDYKSTANVNPDNEIRQMLTYAWLAWKKLGYTPGNITVILDYVIEEEPFEYTFSEYDLKVHENYMISRFRLARKLLEDFKQYMDIKKLTYCPGGGSCTFCPLCGTCLAYQLWYNPGLPTGDVEATSTEDLIKEKISLDEISKTFEERLKAVNRTLMFRYEMKDKEPGDKEGRHPSEIISKFMNKVSSQTEEYDTRMVIEKMVSGRTKKMVKRLGLMDNIDLQQLNVNVADMMMEYLPMRLDKGKVPADIRDELKRSKFPKSRAPYFRYKK
jgi:hypothetical protein